MRSTSIWRSPAPATRSTTRTAPRRYIWMPLPPRRMARPASSCPSRIPPTRSSPTTSLSARGSPPLTVRSTVSVPMVTSPPFRCPMLPTTLRIRSVRSTSCSSSSPRRLRPATKAARMTSRAPKSRLLWLSRSRRLRNWPITRLCRMSPPSPVPSPTIRYRPAAPKVSTSSPFRTAPTAFTATTFRLPAASRRRATPSPLPVS